MIDAMTTESQRHAARENGRKGGRPKRIGTPGDPTAERDRPICIRCRKTIGFEEDPGCVKGLGWFCTRCIRQMWQREARAVPSLAQVMREQR